jgi:hypothetical protein
MLTILILAAIAYGGWRVLSAARASLRQLPRRNEDMFFY